MFRFFLVGLVFALFSNPLFAQVSVSTTIDSSLGNNLEEVIIQGNRIQMPFSKENSNLIVLDKSLIASLPVASVPELLSFVAGIDVRQRGPFGTQADIRIDGGTFDQSLLLINGMKMTDPQTGHNLMNLPVSLNAIERIEILKGAAARKYGVNALNGAINIITTEAKATGLAAQIYSGSSFEKDTSNQQLYGNLGIELQANIAGARTQQQLALSHSQSSGYRYNTAFKNDKILYQNKLKLGASRSLDFLAGYVNNDFGANGFYAAPGDKESKENVQTFVAGAKAYLPINQVWTIRPQLSYRYNKDHYVFIRQKPEVYENVHETNVWDLELNNTLHTTIGTFGIGLEARQELINSNSLGKADRMNYGLYGEYSFNKVSNLLVNIGAYANYNSVFGWELLPGLDAGYNLGTHYRIFLNAGTGQRLPTYTDLYYKGPSNIGNSQLRPEQARYVESGLKYQHAGVQASLSYFNRRTTAFIDWVKNDIAEPWQPQNFGMLKTQGLSLAADYNLARNTEALFCWRAGLTYTYLQAKREQDEHSGKISQYALDNLRNQLIGRLSVVIKKKFQIGVDAKLQQRFNYDHFILLDARIVAHFKAVDLFANCTNLSNVQYQEAGGVPMLGTWLSLGLKWDWSKLGERR